MNAQVTQEAIEAMPRRPKNGYMLFRAEVFDDIRNRNQDKSMTEISQLISHMWNDLDEMKKAKYQIEYEKAKQQYKKDYEAWLKKYQLKEEQVKAYQKEKKEAAKKNKKGSKKVTKAEKDDDESYMDDEERIKELKKKQAVKKQK